MNKLNTRFWEIDALRGIALLLMVIFHVVYSLVFFFDIPLNIHHGLWFWVGRTAGSLFVFLVGVSASVKYAKLRQQKTQQRRIFQTFIKRGLTIVGWGLVITVITYILVPDRMIVFGVLHLIGTSLMLIFPFLLYPWSLLPVGMFLTLAGWLLRVGVRVDFPWLLWLGFIPNNWSTLDYYPLLPWFGVILLGAWIGNWLYPNYQRSFELPDFQGVPFIKELSWLGRHTLIIYLLHMPVILGSLFLLL